MLRNVTSVMPNFFTTYYWSHDKNSQFPLQVPKADIYAKKLGKYCIIVNFYFSKETYKKDLETKVTKKLLMKQLLMFCKFFQH